MAKKLYQLSVLKTEKGFSRRNLFSKKQYDDINRYGEKIEKTFDIKVPYASNHEKQLADQIILTRLNRVYGPKWRVEDNGEEFREVSKLLSYRPPFISAASETERSLLHEIMYMKRRRPWK
ncbi:DEKNAAC101364 [Brettanomyces naardenensis]|uniref:DEKNAAC101364 n=1 Tax=Brettanomyces naardenensis TaxID=13370 RepID=A0A448YHR6_BRENA|nr:DEKNAAC101364 [Brettanomyces naardenensis]